METPRPYSPPSQTEFQAFDEVIISKMSFLFITSKNAMPEIYTIVAQVMQVAALTDDEAIPEPSGSQSERKTSLSISNIEILSVNELLESVRQPLYSQCLILAFPLAIFTCLKRLPNFHMVDIFVFNIVLSVRAIIGNDVCLYCFG